MRWAFPLRPWVYRTCCTSSRRLVATAGRRTSPQQKALYIYIYIHVSDLWKQFFLDLHVCDQETGCSARALGPKLLVRKPHSLTQSRAWGDNATRHLDSNPLCELSLPLFCALPGRTALEALTLSHLFQSLAAIFNPAALHFSPAVNEKCLFHGPSPEDNEDRRGRLRPPVSKEGVAPRTAATTRSTNSSPTA